MTDDRTRDPQLFWCRVKIVADGCWEWQSLRNPLGYGETRKSAWGHRKAHRVAYALANGPIPKGQCVLHSCDNPPCCNPAHLFLGTQADNMRDMAKKGRSWGAGRTHCKNGHEFAGENLFRRADGGRGCRQCQRASANAKYRRRRAEALAS